MSSASVVSGFGSRADGRGGHARHPQYPAARTDGRRLPCPDGARAFTLVETVIATIIVAVMLSAALTTVGVSRVTQHKVALVSRGQLLAEMLLSEILRQSYQDPDGTPVFGRESDESATTRAAFDDVDDYHGWSESPPTAKDGAALANAAGWKWTVTVEWVDPANPTQVRTVETETKRVTITVTYHDVPQASLVSLRTSAR
jgi:type II secretory pathway pseudopilin PulG